MLTRIVWGDRVQTGWLRCAALGSAEPSMHRLTSLIPVKQTGPACRRWQVAF